MMNLEDIRYLFNIFHDGGLTISSFKNEELELRIEIQYLAELIKPTYNFFYLTLESCENLELIPWEEDRPKIVEVNEIFKYELEILEARIKDGKINIQGIANEGDIHNEFGATLSFNVKEVAIKDNELNPVSLSKMQEIWKQYWKGLKA